MNLTDRINILTKLRNYMLSEELSWLETKHKASITNGWFIPEFIELSTTNIANRFLAKEVLESWTSSYNIPESNPHPYTVGIVMAGNIPMVGFHDLLSVFITGHKALIKLSSKDEVLIRHIVTTMSSWDAEINELINFSDLLKNCDAYIATGSNNSSRYFDYYFGKYPHIIRRNKTSVAVLTGNEKNDELEKLADDVYQFFGLGCRNVTKIYVPQNYDFVPLLAAFKIYNYLADHNKYKNNYDYNLALHILNKKIYMTNGSVLLIDDPSIFSPISQLNYEFYTNHEKLIAALKANEDIQCIVGKGLVPFGQAQYPAVNDYADKADTMAFLSKLRGVNKTA